MAFGGRRGSFLFQCKEKKKRKKMTVLCISCSAQGRVAGAAWKHPSGFGPGRYRVGELPSLRCNQSDILLADALLSFQGTIKLDDLPCILLSLASKVCSAALAIKLQHKEKPSKRTLGKVFFGQILILIF